MHSPGSHGPSPPPSAQHLPPASPAGAARDAGPNLTGLGKCVLTSSLGLMLKRILSAFSLSCLLSIMASSSLEALFWKQGPGQHTHKAHGTG